MDADLKAYLEMRFSGLETKFSGLETKFSGLETQMNEKFAAIDVKFEDLENRLIERTRDMQTELLRGFESFSAGQTIRLRKL